MESSTRRSFYSAAIAGLGGLMTAALAAPAAAYLLIRPKSQKQSDFVPAADLATLTVGKPEEVVFRRTRVDGWRVLNEKSTAWVLRKDDQNVVAFAPQCTHLGCAYHWDEKENNFLCPCHTSTFSIDGKVLSGPAPRPLDRLVTKIDQGKILIGTEIQKA
jgi:menaquinol-cytochrome c reductase iron-sulfur subunit